MRARSGSAAFREMRARREGSRIVVVKHHHPMTSRGGQRIMKRSQRHLSIFGIFRVTWHVLISGMWRLRKRNVIAARRLLKTGNHAGMSHSWRRQASAHRLSAALFLGVAAGAARPLLRPMS